MGEEVSHRRPGRASGLVEWSRGPRGWQLAIGGVAMIVGHGYPVWIGFVGGTDPVLWTLLQQDGTAPNTAGTSQPQPRPFPRFVALRAFWAVAVRAAFARGP